MSTPRQQLRDHRLRVTGPRLAVLEAVAELGGHPDATAIAARARARAGTVSTQAVYDVLGVLVDAGLLRRIKPAGGAARYETRVGDNHHHLVCRRCHGIRDVDCATGAAPCLHPADDHGFAVDEAEVVFWGVCAACAEAA